MKLSRDLIKSVEDSFRRNCNLMGDNLIQCKVIRINPEENTRYPGGSLYFSKIVYPIETS